MGGHCSLETMMILRYYKDRLAAEIRLVISSQPVVGLSNGSWGPGAYLSEQPIDSLMEAITLKPHPLTECRLVVTALSPDRYPEGASSLGVPTWFYGHEPSNLFASHIAEYFANSVREDGLLAIAGDYLCQRSRRYGAGDLSGCCQNHLRNVRRCVSYGVFRSQYWTETLPVLPLIKALADNVFTQIT